MKKLLLFKNKIAFVLVVFTFTIASAKAVCNRHSSATANATKTTTTAEKVEDKKQKGKIYIEPQSPDQRALDSIKAQQMELKKQYLKQHPVDKK